MRGAGGAEGGHPALHVIVLGSGGGPNESNTTAFLVRSAASNWSRGSLVAVDAGVHLGAIEKILRDTQPAGLGGTEELSLPYVLQSGPFAGLGVPHASASANAAHIHRTLIDTYLITHPHLDHISGFVINTAGLPGSRPKRLAGLPSTIAAFKTHIFNNVIWPNLSDENNGAGLVTYMRLVEGGSPAFGEGDGKGYLEVSDGLAVKTWGVSHGHCIERHSHRGSGSSASARYGSMDGNATSMQMQWGPSAVGIGSAAASPRPAGHYGSANPNLPMYLQQHQLQRDQMSSQHQGVVPGSTAASGGGRTRSMSGSQPESICVYDSSAYFVRDMATGHEILIFGDVEPDSISLSPRNHHIWQQAAPKIAAGKLAAVFIECSYDDSQSVDRLFGHLAPRYIIEEMAALAAEVRTAGRALSLGHLREQRGSVASGASSDKKKRKREGDDRALSRMAAAQTMRVATGAAEGTSTDEPVSPRTLRSGRGSASYSDGARTPTTKTPHITTPTAELNLADIELPAPITPLSSLGQDGAPSSAPLPLQGLKVVIIHMKDKLNDGPYIGDIILSQLEEYEKEAQLGCEFVISHAGQDLYL